MAYARNGTLGRGRAARRPRVRGHPHRLVAHPYPSFCRAAPRLETFRPLEFDSIERAFARVTERFGGAAVSGGLSGDGVQLPDVRDAFELVGSALAELDSGTDDEVLDRA